MMPRRLLFGLAAMLLALGPAAAIAKPLVHAIPSDIASLDPADIRGQQDQEIGTNVYERLVRMKFNARPDGTLMADPVEVVPELAESWTVDGPVITFKLKPGIKFYPTGNPMTSEDVRYSFERLTRIAGNGRNQAGIAGLFKAEQVEAVDPLTVKITFTDGDGKPTAVPVALTSMKFQQFAVIDSVEVKKHVTAEDPWANEWLKKNLATTGPYYIANRALGQQLELKAVPNHWSGQQPPFEDVVLRVIGNADLVSLIKGGVVDYAAEGLTGRQYDALAASGFPVLHGETPSILRLHMAMDKEPFTDPKVRQAVLYAIPHDRILKTALSGRGKRQICLYNAEDWTCTNNYEKYKADLNKAKELLKEAGKPALSFDFWYSTALPYNSDIAIIIADSLKQIGVTANLKPTPALQLLDAVRARINGVDQNMSGMLLNEGVIWLNDPSTLTNLGLVTKTPTAGFTNWARFSDPQVDELHLKYRNSADRDGRKAAYQTIQDKVAASASTLNPAILVGRTIVVSPKITGVTFSQDPYVRYMYLKPKS
ncbi:ABC-type transport system, substrate-binding protein [Rhodospirillales bacterium URHD0017]|nr:ABC-type transport system, substrate-binding protein [Rhodospirillales bacterium URHD0017]